MLDSAEGKVGAPELPSATSIYIETAYILNESNLIVPLNKYFTDDEFAEYVPEFIDEEGRNISSHLSGLSRMPQGNLRVY